MFYVPGTENMIRWMMESIDNQIKAENSCGSKSVRRKIRKFAVQIRNKGKGVLK